jgi:hypothetical protein
LTYSQKVAIISSVSIVGTLLLCACCIGVFCVYRRKQKQEKKEPVSKEESKESV